MFGQRKIGVADDRAVCCCSEAVYPRKIDPVAIRIIFGQIVVRFEIINIDEVGRLEAPYIALVSICTNPVNAPIVDRMPSKLAGIIALRAERLVPFVFG